MVLFYPFSMQMPGRTYNSGNYRYGFNGKENDNETGYQNYGMREYDPATARFISVDPLTKKYPELTPYQFASNSPIAGIDLDGLEFMNYNDSYIKIHVNYDSKLKQINATSLYRLGETQKGTLFGLTLTILPSKLEERIMNTPANCSNCIPDYDSRVSYVRLGTEAKQVSADDVEKGWSSFTQSQEFRTLRVSKNKAEASSIEKSKEFYTPGISKSIDTWDARIAAVEAVGILGEALGESYLKHIVAKSQGEQSQRVYDVLVILKDGIRNGAIKDKYRDNSSLSDIGNYLLYGKRIENKDLQGVAVKLWSDYSNKTKKEDEKK
jgi:RHS repeat-associated protein